MAHSTNGTFASVAHIHSVEFFEISNPSNTSLKDKSFPDPSFKPSPMPEASFTPTNEPFVLALADTEKRLKAQLGFLKKKLKLWIHRK